MYTYCTYIHGNYHSPPPILYINNKHNLFLQRSEISLLSGECKNKSLGISSICLWWMQKNLPAQFESHCSGMLLLCIKLLLLLLSISLTFFVVTYVNWRVDVFFCFDDFCRCWLFVVVVVASAYLSAIFSWPSTLMLLLPLLLLLLLDFLLLLFFISKLNEMSVSVSPLCSLSWSWSWSCVQLKFNKFHFTSAQTHAHTVKKNRR